MDFDAEHYVIHEGSSIREALTKIQENTYGMVCIASQDEKIIAIATDGDIRLGLLAGLELHDSIAKCFNQNFIWADEGDPRSRLLKHLDSGIRYIPILDEKKRLISVISHDSMPPRKEEEIYFRSRAPVRISFGGGGSDLTRYFLENDGAVINAAISIFSHATMRILDGEDIIINSHDLEDTFCAKNLSEALKEPNKRFSLILAILSLIKPKYGFELNIHSDFPVGSGLGGSATLAAVVLGCFNQVRKDRWDQHELAEIAFQAERLTFGIAGGWQDQYATIFGGVNFLEFGSEENLIHPIRLQPDTVLELEESLILCDTAMPHHSGDIHISQRATMNSEEIKDNVRKNVELTYKIRNLLLAGRLRDFGHALGETWQLKKTFSDMISNNYLDEIYQGAVDNGALGGKILGAGGGGFFLFYVPPFEKIGLLAYLKGRGLGVRQFRFQEHGLQTWTARFKKNKKQMDT